MHFRLSPADPAPARPARSLQSSTPTKSFASISAKCRASCSLPQPAKRRIARMKVRGTRSEEHTSELQSLMRTSYAVFCLKKKRKATTLTKTTTPTAHKLVQPTHTKKL